MTLGWKVVPVLLVGSIILFASQLVSVDSRHRLCSPVNQTTTIFINQTIECPVQHETLTTVTNWTGKPASAAWEKRMRRVLGRLTILLGSQTVTSLASLLSCRSNCQSQQDAQHARTMKSRMYSSSLDGLVQCEVRFHLTCSHLFCVDASSG